MSENNDNTVNVKVCHWKACSSKFSKFIQTRLENDSKLASLKWLFNVEKSPCMWNCKCWPSIKIDWKKIENVNPIKASKEVNKKLNNN